MNQDETTPVPEQQHKKSAPEHLCTRIAARRDGAVYGCGRMLPVDSFYRKGKDRKLSRHCRACTRKRLRELRAVKGSKRSRERKCFECKRCGWKEGQSIEPSFTEEDLQSVQGGEEDQDVQSAQELQGRVQDDLQDMRQEKEEDMGPEKLGEGDGSIEQASRQEGKQEVP